MMFQTGHGAKTTPTGPDVAVATAQEQDFGYLFPEAAESPHSDAVIAALKDLAAKMVAQSSDPGSEDSLTQPAFMTYLGQFIDHDITSQLNLGMAIDDNIEKPFTPIPRDEVVTNIANQRTGQFDLDSVYGAKSPGTSLEQRLVAAMRHPTLRAKMLIQRPEDVSDPVLGNPARVVPPLDGANDILRLGRLIGDSITEEEIEAITDDGLRAFFFKRDADGNESINRHRAILGDGRNDENLFIAQIQLAWLRLHNRIVDTCPDPNLRNGPQDTLFGWAQDQTRSLYQWVVLHDWLKRVCDPDIFEHVLNNRAPLYAKFVQRVAPPAGTLPLPVEFSFGAFRFGHSMVRDAYDWNARFDNASFDLFFAFTGSHKNPMFGVTDARLPSNWPADWTRVVEDPDPSFPMRATRRIDTRVAPPLSNLPDAAAAKVKLQIRNLAARNLLRGQIFNLPSAQQCIAGIEEQVGYTITPLSADQLTSGEVGQTLVDTDLITQTPLWFYTLKEAEVLTGGEKLGPLGSMLVADTIVGLMLQDPNSVLNRTSDSGSPWTPNDGAKPDGITVSTFKDVVRAGLLL